MNRFSVNGIDRPAPVPQEGNLEGLLSFVQSNLLTVNSLLSSIRVNGVELESREEADLAQVALSEIDTVDLTFSHPREMAEETLQALRSFITHLSTLSQAAAAEVKSAQPRPSLHKLIDGLEVMVESVAQVKRALKIEGACGVDALENELLLLLQNLLFAEQGRAHDAQIDLLHSQLPSHLLRWEYEGIPALIRSRDS